MPIQRTGRMYDSNFVYLSLFFIAVKWVRHVKFSDGDSLSGKRLVSSLYINFASTAARPLGKKYDLPLQQPVWYILSSLILFFCCREPSSPSSLYTGPLILLRRRIPLVNCNSLPDKEAVEESRFW